MDVTGVEQPEEDDLDEAAILRRLDGDRGVRLTSDEAAEVVAHWRASGRPLNECQRHTGINPHRHPAAAQEEAS